MLALARIAPPDPALDGDTTAMDKLKNGLLRVVFHGNIRWARPAYPMGRFTPPSVEFLKKYSEKLGVWVAPEWGSNEDERSCHLVWFSFEPFGAKVLPPDVEADFPKKQLFFTANFEVVVDDEAGTVDIRLVDNTKTDGDPAEYPARLQFDKEDGSLSLKLGAGEGPDDLTVTLSGVKNAAKLELGDAAAGVALATKLEALYTSLKAMIDGHTHAAGTLIAPAGGGPVTGVSGGPASPAPAWDAAIVSTQLLVPENP